MKAEMKKRFVSGIGGVVCEGVCGCATKQKLDRPSRVLLVWYSAWRRQNRNRSAPSIFGLQSEAPMPLQCVFRVVSCMCSVYEKIKRVEVLIRVSVGVCVYVRWECASFSSVVERGRAFQGRHRCARVFNGANKRGHSVCVEAKRIGSSCVPLAVCTALLLQWC